MLAAAVLCVLCLALAGCADVLEQVDVDKVTDGFDYSVFDREDVDWAGPKAGERIDLTRLKDAEGRELAGQMGGRPAVLASVDRNCGFCNLAAPELSLIHERVGRVGVPYYFVSFKLLEESSLFYRYAQALKPGVAAFAWSPEGPKPSEALDRMVVPSHLLVDGEGRVLKAWPGTSHEPVTRRRMANQIVADVNAMSSEWAGAPR